MGQMSLLLPNGVKSTDLKQCLTLLEIYLNYFFLLEILEIFWFRWRVCAFVINISYNLCTSECVSVQNSQYLFIYLIIHS